MKQYAILLLLFLFCISGFSQKTNSYDSVLAKKLGADDYGMKHYVVAFLYAGPVVVKDSAERQRIQMAHLKNIQKLSSEGKMVVAGPFLDNKDLRGLFVFNVATIEEARALTETDPAVKAGLLRAELHPWYGSAALMQVSNLHQNVQRRGFME